MNRRIIDKEIKIIDKKAVCTFIVEEELTDRDLMSNIQSLDENIAMLEAQISSIKSNIDKLKVDKEELINLLEKIK